MTNPARTIANSHEGSKSASKIPTAKATNSMQNIMLLMNTMSNPLPILNKYVFYNNSIF